MGDNIYTSYWQSILPTITRQFEEGKTVSQIEVKELQKYGKRTTGYYANFRIVSGVLQTPKKAHAHGRDFHAVLSTSDYFKHHLSLSTLQITITNDFSLRIQILSGNAPDFFIEEDFVQLKQFAKQTKNDSEEHQEAYSFLQATYEKVHHWAKQTQQKTFPAGSVSIRKRPTNQANKFEWYQWAKIYPTNEAKNAGVLAFTVGINAEDNFDIKIDTVGLEDDDERRQKYFRYRGDYKSSPIVKSFQYKQILDKEWKYLIDLSANIILDLKPQYDIIYKDLTNTAAMAPDNSPAFKEDNMKLNTILFGPPGTGKTYSTINKALQIIDPEFYKANKSQRSALNNRFEELLIKDWSKPNGQIAFITFHQSLSYEDFIEGIKPIKPINSIGLQYEIQDGIFKSICLEAIRRSKYLVTIDGVQKPLTRDLFIDFYYSLSETLPSQTSPSSKIILKTKEGYPFELFQNTAESIVVKAGEKRTSLSVSVTELLAVLFEDKVPAYKSYENLIIEKILEGKDFQKSTVNNGDKKFVLIIDEINRGNVSQVFGELITLIEEDKRGGEEERLQVFLPYSKKPFTVPSNLYIMGTMNTADRSVEALDTALRRRFVFEEMEPKPGLLTPQYLFWRFWWKYEDVKWEDLEFKAREKALWELLGVDFDFDPDEKVWKKMAAEGKSELQVSNFDVMNFSKGVHLDKLLVKINDRLSALLTKDHTIGHAWLMDVYSLSDLQTAFKNKIIPLLQEYFYNNYAKIGLVLGDRFFEEPLKVSKSMFATFKNGNEIAEDYTDKLIYKFKNTKELILGDFKSIYE